MSGSASRGRSVLTAEPSTVTPSRSIQAASARGPARRLSHGSSAAPADMAAVTSRMPGDELSGCTWLTRSSGPIPCDRTDHRARCSTVRWLRSTPLGSPVEPDV